MIHFVVKRTRRLVLFFTFLLAALTISRAGIAEDVTMPDPNLTNAVRESLGLTQDVTITQEILQRLTDLIAVKRQIHDITGLEHATQLTQLSLSDNEIVDISPLSGLTQLTELYLGNNEIVDISPLSGLTQLIGLYLGNNEIVDISPLSGLTQLTELYLSNNEIVDISPLSGLTQLTELYLGNNEIVDISPLSGLTQLTRLGIGSNKIVDISPLSGLTQLTQLWLTINKIVDISPLSGLTQLSTLHFWYNSIVDISPLSGLTQLTRLGIGGNKIVDISPLSGLTQLWDLSISSNEIVDISPLSGLTQLSTLGIGLNKIVDISPLSGLTQITRLHLNGNKIVDISPLSGLTQLSTLGINANSIEDITPLSGLVNLQWLKLAENPIQDMSALCPIFASNPDLDVDIKPEICDDGTIRNTIVSLFPAIVKSPAIGKQLMFSLNITGGENVVGYQATVIFDTTALRYVEHANSDYLPAGAFVVPATKVEGNTMTLAAASLAGERNGDGTLATIIFEVVDVKASTVSLSDVLLTDGTGGSLSPEIEAAEITEPTHLSADVNQDGVVNIVDLTLVASNFGKQGENAADINRDAVVNIIDLTLVAAAFGNTAAAPIESGLNMTSAPTRSEVAIWLREARLVSRTDPVFQRGVLMLERLFASLTPKKTDLFSNYPNPFNPETWIPYQLAKASDVKIAIYDARGMIVRRLALGTQPAGSYTRREYAAYWDGRNEFGEPVASGIYFYTLTAGKFTATRKMLIRK